MAPLLWFALFLGGFLAGMSVRPVEQEPHMALIGNDAYVAGECPVIAEMEKR